jgi:hypothetical protein
VSTVPASPMLDLLRHSATVQERTVGASVVMLAQQTCGINSESLPVERMRAPR